MTRTNAERARAAASQYRAVAHLASSLALVHQQIAPMIDAGIFPDLIEMRGKQSAEIMETLGNILNEMDAVDDAEDAWMQPIFEEAHRLWPIATTPAHPATDEVRERRFVALVSGLSHSGDDGYIVPDDADDAQNTLDRLIAEARDIRS